MTDVWPAIHAEREALAADLAGLGENQWEVGSLCRGWTVRDVTAHMTATARITPGSFFPKLVGSGLRLSRLQAKDIVTERGRSPADTLDRFRSIVAATTGPPGPKATMLGETLVHAEDVRRPLGIIHHYPVDDLAQVADFYKGSNLVLGTKRRIAGVRLSATDTNWSHGSGPAVTGHMLDLLMAMAGRKAALDALGGEGVTVLRGR